MKSVAAVSSRPAFLPDAQLLVTGALVLIVISMVIPLSPGLLDFGFALSIATATLVLVMASLVAKPADFQAFPVLLLVSLVIRLSLNVSSTRLILTEGHSGAGAAGQVISGFASFVAGGSLLVGLTIFAVISVVNFMVITKGSGRMAEVAARFALDSLPGKQLAIDGDLNAGAIDHEEAKRRRISEQREISFFGSLDGASKFVKGDAIAGILITLINLVVGLCVGVMVHGLAPGEALATYSHLTIGDGLVSQIPALVTSMAAALLLSRGGATDTTAQLLSQQILRSWQPAAVVAAALAVISFVPGMPQTLFLILSAVSAVVAWRIAGRDEDDHDLLPEIDEPAPIQPAQRVGDVLDVDEISVEIGADLVAATIDRTRGLGCRISNLRIFVARNYGVILPDVRITDSAELLPNDYLIRVQGVVRGRGTLQAGQVLALGAEEMLQRIGGEAIREPVYASPARWILPSEQDEVATLGLTVVSPMEVLSTHLMEVIKTNLPALMTLSSLQRQLDELKSMSDPDRADRYSRYFENLIPDKVTPEVLLSVLRALLDEGLSIRNLLQIIDAICEFRNIESPDVIYELVRKRMRGLITQQFSDADGALIAVQLHPAWEAEFVKSDHETGQTNGVSLSPTVSRKLLEAIRAGLEHCADHVVVLVPDHRRRMVRQVLLVNGISRPVLGLEEVDPAAQVELVGAIEVR